MGVQNRINQTLRIPQKECHFCGRDHHKEKPFCIICRQDDPSLLAGVFCVHCLDKEEIE